MFKTNKIFKNSKKIFMISKIIKIYIINNQIFKANRNNKLFNNNLSKIKINNFQELYLINKLLILIQ